ncbi:sporulation protein YjcZ [Paenibacillus sp. LMG 31456]|uniref:Sporulation protein YjcZ n=1 Tax=Paenibacillus foliorum TaxID=2654974 RepID=A0A972JXE6_9BACL|nr:sporulation protein YjcZ [Paenibacillus foliorum]NOU92394.1 sporulation protein YjcZ [Paenibacillus foliorum]
MGFDGGLGGGIGIGMTAAGVILVLFILLVITGGGI